MTWYDYELFLLIPGDYYGVSEKDHFFGSRFPNILAFTYPEYFVPCIISIISRGTERYFVEIHMPWSQDIKKTKFEKLSFLRPFI